MNPGGIAVAPGAQGAQRTGGGRPKSSQNRTASRRFAQFQVAAPVGCQSPAFQTWMSRPGGSGPEVLARRFWPGGSGPEVLACRFRPWAFSPPATSGPSRPRGPTGGWEQQPAKGSVLSFRRAGWRFPLPPRWPM